MALLLCRKLRGDEGIWNYSVTCFVGVMLPRTEPVTGYTAPGEWREYFCSNMAKSGLIYNFWSAKQGVWDNDKNTIHLPRQYLEKASKINDFMKHLGAYYTTTKPFEFRSEPWYDKENKKRVLLHYSRILMNILLWYELDRRFLPNSVGRQARFIFEDMHYRVLRI